MAIPETPPTPVASTFSVKNPRAVFIAKLTVSGAFLEIFEPTVVDGTYPSLAGRISEFFGSIGRAISNLFCSIFGWEPPTPGFISAEMIAQLGQGAGHEMSKTDAKQLSTQYQDSLIRMFHGGNADFSDLLDTIHISGLRDVEIQETFEHALGSLEEGEAAEAALERFEHTLWNALDEFRYIRLVKPLNNENRVSMEEIDNSGEGIGWEPPTPGFISAEMIAQLGQGAGHEMSKTDAKQLSTQYQDSLIRMFHGGNADFSDLLDTIHISGLRDVEIQETFEHALGSLEEGEAAEAALERFEHTLWNALDEFRYVRLVKLLNNENRVRMEETDNSGEGNCFLYSCANGLKRITEGAETITHHHLREGMSLECIQAISNPEDEEFRQHFINHFNLGEAGFGQVIPTLKGWEDELLKRYRAENIIKSTPAVLEAAIRALPPQATALKNLEERDIGLFIEKLSANNENPRFILWENAVIDSLGGNDHLPTIRKELLENPLLITVTMKNLNAERHEKLMKKVPEAAKEFRNKVKKRHDYQLEPWEVILFVRYGATYILNPANDLGPLEAKRELFRQRVSHIINLYRKNLNSNGTWNGGLEALLAARVLKRPIVILEGHPGGPWVYQTLAGKEFLLPLDKLHERPPITVLHQPGHYQTGFYPPCIPARA